MAILDDSLAWHRNDDFGTRWMAGCQTTTTRAEEDPVHSITRRNVVLSAAAGAAFGLSKPLEIIAPASAQQGGGPTALNPRGMKFHRFKVGDIEVTQVLDGAI